MLFYPFLTQYYNRKEGKDLHFRYTNHITITSRVWQAIWGVDLFTTKKVENGLRIIIFHKKWYFTHFWPNIDITTGRKKKIWSLDIPPISQETHECGKLSGVQIFLVQKSQKMASGSLFFTKSALVGTPSIIDNYPRNYIPKHIKPMSTINKITCGLETCTSTMLLKNDLNKWRLTQLSKLDKLYINDASTRLLQISNKD